MKCPKLRLPEATEARNQNSIGEKMEKKPGEKPGSVGETVLPLSDETSRSAPGCRNVRLCRRIICFLWSCPGGLYRGFVSAAHLVVTVSAVFLGHRGPF